MRNPKQLYIIALVFLLRYWPEQFILSGSDNQLLFSVITLQLGFVIACNILTKEPWIYAVILIEAFCMLFNVTFFLVTAISSALHEQIMLCAFIIELLIISMSLQGAIVERSNNYRLSMSGSCLWAARSSLLAAKSAERSLS